MRCVHLKRARAHPKGQKQTCRGKSIYFVRLHIRMCAETELKRNTHLVLRPRTSRRMQKQTYTGKSICFVKLHTRTHAKTELERHIHVKGAASHTMMHARTEWKRQISAACETSHDNTPAGADQPLDSDTVRTETKHSPHHSDVNKICATSIEIRNFH